MRVGGEGDRLDWVSILWLVIMSFRYKLLYLKLFCKNFCRFGEGFKSVKGRFFFFILVSN